MAQDGTERDDEMAPLERISLEVDRAKAELAAARNALAAAQDPERIYGRVISTIQTVVGESYLTFGPEGEIRYVDPVALRLMDLSAKDVVGRDYANWVEANYLPSKLKVNVPERSKVILLDTRRLVALGPCAIIHSTFPDDSREYGGIVRVHGLEADAIKRGWGLVNRNSAIINGLVKERTAIREKSEED